MKSNPSESKLWITESSSNDRRTQRSGISARGTTMRALKYLPIMTAGLVLFFAVSSNAQQGIAQSQRQQIRMKPAAVTPGGPTVRDHRKTATGSQNAAGGVAVTSSGRRRGGGGSPCIKSVLGGPCTGGTVAKVAKGVAKVEPFSVGATGVYQGAKQALGSSSKRSGTRDHRKN
jgi:hypothetical protein